MVLGGIPGGWLSAEKHLPFGKFSESYKVAEAAVALMERMLRSEPVPKRTTVPAEILARD